MSMWADPDDREKEDIFRSVKKGSGWDQCGTIYSWPWKGGEWIT